MDQTTITTYVSSSFTALAERNLYVVDIKNSESSTWNPDNFDPLTDRDRVGGCKLVFQERVQFLNLGAWFSLFSELVNNLERMRIADYFLVGDSLNFAVITDDDKVVQSIRPYLFDFSLFYFPRPLAGRATSRVSKKEIKLVHRTDVLLLTSLFYQGVWSCRKRYSHPTGSTSRALLD